VVCKRKFALSWSTNIKSLEKHWCIFEKVRLIHSL
jgi:hypothetical protein